MSDINLKDVIVRFWTSVHEGVFRATDGRLLNRVLEMPVVRLTTVGRRSGMPRVAMLTAPISDADGVVLVASNAGDHRNPAWYLNLLAHPVVSVMMDGQTWTARARVATAEERAELWPRIKTVNPGYGQYEAKTLREIGLVIVARPGRDATDPSTTGTAQVSPGRTTAPGSERDTDR
jgi:deazaflavin-dependent oxidoreductase (nitroreductase family)